MLDILQWNSDLEANNIEPIQNISLFQIWLWETDPGEELHPKILLNTNQLVGLLYCRKLAWLSAQQSVPTQLNEQMQTTDAEPKQMNLKQLLDTLDNICIEWPKFIQKHPDQKDPANLHVFQYIDMCFARFGVLVSYAHDKETLNDVQFTEEYNETHRKVTLGCIRRFLNSFLILYRHFFLFSHAHTVSAPFYECGIRQPHLEASMENFDLLCMHYLIPIGARLRYKNEFRGMYNHISQVMFFHNPTYDRQGRVEWNQIKPTTDAIQILPALLELQPDIDVKYEEDHFMHLSKLENWTWLLVSGRVYLIQPDKTILYANDITSLFEIFIKNKQ